MKKKKENMKTNTSKVCDSCKKTNVSNRSHAKVCDKADKNIGFCDELEDQEHTR